MQFKNRWALITGASSGIGAEFARQLAARGMNLLLCARRVERLESLAEELQSKFGIQTEICAADLGKPEDCEALITRTRELPEPLFLLVNNAGLGNVAKIEQTEPERMLQLVDVNVRSLTQLTYAFLPAFVQRNEGAIINIASVAAFQPIAYMSVYAASKAYVLHLTEGLQAELAKSAVRLLAVCPGTTRTEFFDEAGADNWLQERRSHTPEQVVTASLKALEKGKTICIPGWMNRMMTTMPRFFSRKAVAKETKRFFKSAVES